MVEKTRPAGTSEEQSKTTSNDSSIDSIHDITNASNDVSASASVPMKQVNSHQRKRTPSAIMLEKLEVEKLEQEIQLKKLTRVKRKYTKRRQKPVEDLTSLASKNGSLSLGTSLDEESPSSEEEIDFICCLCSSDVDYTDLKGNLNIIEDKTESKGTENVSADDIGDIGEVQDTIKEENTNDGENTNRYDPHNALVLCDTPSCNRVYHQHCHFTPLFVIPRGQWFCHICTYKQYYQCQKIPLAKTKKNGIQTNTPKKRGRPRKNKSLSPTFSSGLIHLKETLPFIPTDQIYPSKSNIYSVTTTDAKPPSTLSIPLNNLNLVDKSSHNTILHKFEKESSELKTIIIAQNLSKLRSTISQCLLRIRTSQNAIRIYTESERARKDLLVAATEKRCLPAELVLSKHKLLSNQWRIKTLLESLQNYIKYGGVSNDPDGRIEPRCDEDDESLTDDEENDEGNKHLNIVEISSETGNDNGGKATKSSQEKGEDVGEDSKSNKDDEAIITCTLCYSSESTESNDILLCDGMYCCRAFHMECLSPKVTKEEIDKDPDGTWFCPYCATLGKLIHYVQTEYYGDDEEGAMGDEWEEVDDVFKDLGREMEVWCLGKDGVRTTEIKNGMVVPREEVLNLLGLEDDTECHMEREHEDDEDDEDYEDSKKIDKEEEEDSKSASSESLSEVLSVENQIDKSEIMALNSGSDSEIENASYEIDFDESLPLSKRRKKRKLSDKKQEPDIGTLDERNIVHGKRRRAKVDYQRLNDAMFGQLHENEVGDMFGDESHDEYQSSGESDDSESPLCKEKDTSGSLSTSLLKKKRGRPPKKKEESRTPPSSPKKMKKRRGRPPKIKTSAESEKPSKEEISKKISHTEPQAQISSNPTKKKRGRPRKRDMKNGAQNFLPGFQSDKNGGNSVGHEYGLTTPKPKKKRGRPPKQTVLTIDDNIAISSMMKMVLENQKTNGSSARNKTGHPPVIE